jgi:hypothetical protein
VIPCRLVEIYHSFFSYHEVGGGGFLHLYGGNSQLLSPKQLEVSTELHIPKDEILQQLTNCVTDVQQHASCSPLMDEWDSVVTLNVHPFHPRRNSPTVGI